MPKGQRGQRICQMDNCGRLVKAYGYCEMHWRRVCSTGDPNGVKRGGVTPTPPEDRFWRYVNKDGPDGCWLWTAKSQTTNGYPLFAVSPRDNRAAHRFAFELLVGPIPDGYELDHLCHRRKCVNPSHLEPVTKQENLRRSRDHIGAERVREIASVGGKYGCHKRWHVQRGVSAPHCELCLVGG